MVSEQLLKVIQKVSVLLVLNLSLQLNGDRGNQMMLLYMHNSGSCASSNVASGVLFHNKKLLAETFRDCVLGGDLGSKKILDSIQVDWQVLFWLYSSTLLV